MFNRGQDGGGISSVTSANLAGGRKVAEFLVAGGHRRIAHIAGWQGRRPGATGSAGFVEALAAARAQPGGGGRRHV